MTPPGKGQVERNWRRPGVSHLMSRLVFNGSKPMVKTIDILSDAIRNTKHPFRQVDDRPDKPKKHRYERRKVREYIRLGDWSEQSAT